MHKLEKDFCHFGGEQLRLKEHLESLGKEKIVWESFRTVDSISPVLPLHFPFNGKISPVFKGKAPALSIELMFNADKTLKEVKIVDRAKSITAKYDSSGKLVMDEWLLKHPECMETAKVYEQRLNALLTYTHSIQKHVQKPTLAEPPKQAFQPHAIKTEIPAQPAEKEVIKTTFRCSAGRGVRQPFTPAQIETRNKEIDAFCEEKGIDVKNHPPLHNLALKNLKKIVAVCEEKHIPFTPYRNFLPYPFNSFMSNLKALEEHGIDPVKFSYTLVYPAQNLSENLKTCAEQGRNAVEEALVLHLNMNSEKFREFLKTYVPPERLSPEEKEKKTIAILVKNGMEEKDIKEYVKKKAPERVEKIIGICNKHSFDWKKHQIVFIYAPNTLNSNLDACASHNIDPVKFELLADLTLPNEKFNSRLREIIEKGIQPKVLSEEEKRSKVLEIMAKEGLGENEINDHVKRRGLHPVTVERIIEICNRHHLDWKTQQTVFACGPNILESNLSLCEFNNVDPVKFSITSRLILPRDDFKEYLKVLMVQKGLEFKELPAQ
jgi:hypothetical protein